MQQARSLMPYEKYGLDGVMAAISQTNPAALAVAHVWEVTET
jgi:hypothetical protein